MSVQNRELLVSSIYECFFGRSRLHIRTMSKLSLIVSMLQEKLKTVSLTLLFCLSAGGGDYIELTDVPLIFQPGDRPVVGVSLVTLSDTPVEGDETLSADLSPSPTNIDSSRINIIVPQATVTITEEIGIFILLSSSTHTQSLKTYFCRD